MPALDPDDRERIALLQEELSIGAASQDRVDHLRAEWEPRVAPSEQDRNEQFAVAAPDGTVTGVMGPRWLFHLFGLPHRAVHVGLVTPAGLVLLQRRSRNKADYPGAWDSPVAGHVAGGAGFDDTAVIEILEELFDLEDGAEAQLDQVLAGRPQPIGIPHVHEDQDNSRGLPYLNREVVRVFGARLSEFGVAHAKLQPSEVSGLYACLPEEVREILRGEPVAPGGANAIPRFLAWLEAESGSPLSSEFRAELELERGRIRERLPLQEDVDRLEAIWQPRLRPTGKDCEERFAVTQPDGTVTGAEGPRWLFHLLGIPHRAAHVGLSTPSGLVLLQRRASHKADNPDRWDMAVTGHVSAGPDEDGEATYLGSALRELVEELGLEEALYRGHRNARKQRPDSRCFLVGGLLHRVGEPRPDPAEPTDRWWHCNVQVQQVFAGVLTPEALGALQPQVTELAGLYLCSEAEVRRLHAQETERRKVTGGQGGVLSPGGYASLAGYLDWLGEINAEPLAGLVILDYDGVMVDSIKDLAGVCTRALEATGCGRKVTEDDLRGLNHMNYAGVAELGGMVGPFDPSNPAFVRFQAALDAELRADRALPKWQPGMVDAIAKMAGRYRLAVVTNNVRERVERGLVLAGVREAVSEILDGQDRRSKADKIRECVARLAPPGRPTYMVGDAVSDMEAAQDACVEPVAVWWGFQNAARLAACCPRYHAATPADFVRWLDECG